MRYTGWLEDSRDDLREQIKRMEQNQAQLVSSGGRFVTLEGNGIELEFMLALFIKGVDPPLW